MLFRPVLLVLLIVSLAGHAGAQTNSAPQAPSSVLSADASVQNESRTQLLDEGYRFCHDPNYRLFQDEKDAICHQLDAFEGRCPELSAACQRPSWETANQAPDSDGSWDWNLLSFDGSWLAALFRILFWLALGVGALLLVRAIIRQAQGWKEERDLEKNALLPVQEQPEELPFEELRSGVLLDMARDALEKNQLTESLHLTYRATVVSLSDADWVKAHKSKTSGDYLRHLQKLESARSDPPVGEVRQHLLDLDRQRFGGNPQPELTSTLLQRARSIASKLGQVALFLLAFSTLSCDRARGPEPPQAPQAPRGKQLLFELMRARTSSVTRRMQRVTELPPETTAVVSLDADLRALEWRTIEQWVMGGGHLVVARPNSGFSEIFGIDTRATSCSAPLIAPDLSLVKFGPSRAFDDDLGGLALAHCGTQTLATSVDYGHGWITLIADDSLFENVSLAAAENATLAMHLVGFLGTDVQYLGPWTGRGALHPLQSIARAGFGWWVLHVLLAGLVYAWSRGKRFTTPIDPPESKRRAFCEHAQALSLKYQQAGASGWALRNYAEWVHDSLRRRAPSTKADLKSLTRAATSNPAEAAKLREALTAARRADELGESQAAHVSTFLRLKSATLDISEVSRRRATKDKD